MNAALRIVDAGSVGAARSQSLWHGIASSMGDDAAPVLSLCRPAEPYVCLGYHRRLAELDLDACRSAGLPVIRRQVGGGPVYVDADQLFFQITMPRRRAPALVADLYAALLGPAAEAFRDLGLDACLRGLNDIAVGGRKISGTAAGQIGGAVTVVGNLLFSFRHERMVEVLALPTARMREECLRLMRRHVTSVAAEGLSGPSFEDAAAALVAAYARRLALDPVPDALGPAEENAIARWEARFADPEWTAGPLAGPAPLRQVKICAGVFLFEAAHDGVRVEASVVEGHIDHARIDAPRLDGTVVPMASAVVGQPVDARAIAARLAPFGPGAEPVVALFRRVVEAARVAA